jgi:hypothetical protein
MLVSASRLDIELALRVREGDTPTGLSLGVNFLYQTKSEMICFD